MSRKSKQTAANDNGELPKIRLEVAESQPLGIVEVEIFDALISNIEALIANDNDPPPIEGKAHDALRTLRPRFDRQTGRTEDFDP